MITPEGLDITQKESKIGK